MDRPRLNGTRPPAPRRWRRRLARAVLVLAVLAAHLWVSEELAWRMQMAADGGSAMQRLDPIYARTLQPAAAPVVAPSPAPVPPKPRRVSRALPPAAAASEPEKVAAEEQPAPQAQAPLAGDSVAQAAAPAPDEPENLEPADETAQAADLPPEPTVPAAPSTAASAPAGPPFEWPPSTRMSYTLYGYYRGEVHGSAQVEWIRAGERYQVHIDVAIGPSFAPLMTRRMSSDGRITPQGLAPELYDEETRVAFRTRRAAVRFGPDWITLNNGREVPAPPGVQDTASQFVQLTYRITLKPELLTPGQAIEFPLALPRRQDRWYYDVVGAEDLATPFGTVQAYHLRPRRERKRRDELTADVWFAPTLLYLPVRIQIRQDEENYIDLMIAKLPEVEAPAASSAATAAVNPGTPP